MDSISSTITLHMVSSLDGFIASADQDISWMQSKDTFQKGMTLTDSYIQEFLDGIDCYVMGSKTYEQALELGWPYGNKPVFVLSSKNLNSTRQEVHFFSGSISELVRDQLAPLYQNIWLVGGAQTAKAFLQANLVDKIVISIMPVILGGGILFFDMIGKQIDLRLLDVMTFKDGMVELTYEVRA